MAAYDIELVRGVRNALAQAADSAKAGPMQAYMKSEMPYRGIPSPALKAVLRPLLAEHALDEETWRADGAGAVGRRATSARSATRLSPWPATACTASTGSRTRSRSTST